MKLFRKILFWCHLAAGVIAGIVILTMCVTGVLLTYEKQTIDYAEREMRYVAAPPNAERLPMNEILARAQAAKPDAKPSAVTVQSNPNAAVNVALGREGQIFVNPYSGEITGTGAPVTREFFHVATDIHRWLGAHGDSRPLGKAITGACNFAFLFLAISGLYIWFPRRLSWKHLKPITVLNFRLRGRAWDFNWHNSIGIFCAPVLIVLTLTGVVISYQWAGNLVYTLTGNQPPPQQQNAPRGEQKPPFVPGNINDLLAAAESVAPGWKSINLRLPNAPEAAVTATIDEGTSLNIFGRSALTLNQQTAAVTKWERYEEQNAGRQARSWMRFMHTGESFGLVGQTIAGLASLGGAFLVWTGISLSLRRFRGWLAKRKKTSASAAAEV